MKFKPFIKFFFSILILLIGLLKVYSNQFEANTVYNVCFTPYQNCTGQLLNLINSAQESIYIQAYTFSSYLLENALIQAKKRGVKVMVILDRSQFSETGFYSSAKSFIKNHIPVWCDEKPNIAHNKVMIIDQKFIETGSFNYTHAAQNYNTENMLIITSSALAAMYLSNWQQRLNLSRGPILGVDLPLHYPRRVYGKNL